MSVRLSPATSLTELDDAETANQCRHELHTACERPDARAALADWAIKWGEAVIQGLGGMPIFRSATTEILDEASRLAVDADDLADAAKRLRRLLQAEKA